MCVGDSNEELLETMKEVETEYGKYFRPLGLKESQAKQMHIVFTKNKEEGNEYRLNGRPSEKRTRLLGVTVTEDWSFDDHISSVVQRMGERIPHIRAISHSVEKSVLIRISRSLVITIAEFACEFTLRKASNQRRVQKMLNVLLRVITMSDIMRSVEGMLRETELLNINLLVRYYSVWSVQRLINHKNAWFPYSLIDWERETGYETRHHLLRLKWRPKCKNSAMG